MATQRSLIPLDFTKGLDEYNETTTTPGLTICQNWVPEANGVLRAERGWQPTSTTGLTGTRSGRGVIKYVPAAGARVVAVQATSGTQYKLTAWPYSNLPGTGGSWTDIETVTSSPSTRPLAMAAGAGYLLYCSPEFPSQRIRRWDGTTASDASTDAIAGRCLAYHNNRFFVGGSTAQPTWLYHSELGSSTTWNISTNFIPVGQDDGEPIEDIVPWDQGLLIGKENSCWYLSGFGPDTFALHRLDRGGVAPGRTLVPAPNGIVAVGRDRVWWFAGSGFQPVARPIASSYSMSGNFMSGAYLDGCCYIVDEGSGRNFVWDLETQNWHTTITGTAAEGPGLVASIGSYLFGVTKTGSTNSILLYKTAPGSRAHDINVGETYQAKTSEMWIGETAQSSTMLRLHLKLRQRGGTTSQTALSVKFYADGTLRQTLPVVTRTGTPLVFRTELYPGVAARYSHQIEFVQALLNAEAAVFDIEQAVMEIEVEEPR